MRLKIEDQIVSYKLHELSAETLSNQLSPTLIALGESTDLTRAKEASATTNTFNTSAFGLGTTLYSETRGIGNELTQGKAVDTVGEVCFAYRTANTIMVDGITIDKDRKADRGKGANRINKVLNKESFFYNSLQKHYKSRENLQVGFTSKGKEVF